jgi:phosphatidylserine/phosphatidylglycerophosphate/cardiolipin synthase-like enzyme
VKRSAGLSAVLIVAVLALGFVSGFVVGAYGRSTVTVTETFRTLVTTTVVHADGTVTTVSTATVTQTVSQVRDVCFSRTTNCASIIVSLIDSARRSVLVAAFWFYRDHIGDQIADALIRAHRRGVEVRVVIEAANVKGSEYQKLKDAGVSVRLDGNPYLMHHKFVVVDGEAVITGSYNFHAHAEEYNDENLLVIFDERIAALYAQEFERVWSET